MSGPSGGRATPDAAEHGYARVLPSLLARGPGARKLSCECISDECLDLFGEVFAQHPFEKAAVVGCQVREGCPCLRPERNRGDAVAPDQLSVCIDPIGIGGIEPLVKPINRSWQVGIRVQLRHQHGDGGFDIGRWCADSARWASSGRHVDHRDRRRVMISM